ncbi:MAG: ABC transporter permease [Chloroflexi bacterium]|nr:ABC transporter permease [Chloroflexota bacterium]
MFSLTRQLHLAYAFWLRDWYEQKSYHFAFIFRIFSILLTLFLFYEISRLVIPRSSRVQPAYTGDYFSYILIGLAMQDVANVGILSVANKLRIWQTTGILETILAEPFPVLFFLVYTPLWDLTFAFFRLMIYVFVGILWHHVTLSHPWQQCLCASLLLGISYLAFLGLGWLAAAFILWFKRGNPILWLFNGLASLVSGVYFSPDILPFFFQIAAKIFPLTYTLHGLRLLLLEDATLPHVWSDVLVLAGMAAIFLGIGLCAFQRTLVWTQKAGNLANY